MSAKIFIADAPGGGLLYAAADPRAHHVEPGVAKTRFAAILHPYRAAEAAKAALLMAGGENVREWLR